MTKPKIIVGVDGSESSALALRWAEAEGRVRQLPVVALMAWGWMDQHHAVMAPAFDPEYAEADAAAALRTYVHEAVSEEFFDNIERRIVNDLPARALLEASATANLLVVGGRQIGQVKQLLVGSVASQCLSHAPCPVAVVHGDWDPTPRLPTGRIVVGVDGSDGSHAALRYAAEEAQLRDAELEIVHAWTVPVAGSLPLLDVQHDHKLFKDAARRVTEAAYDEVVGDSSNKPPATSTTYGDAASRLVEHAKDADLIVVGSRGRGGFAGLLLGSVARQVSRTASCPVVVVPDRGQRNASM